MCGRFVAKFSPELMRRLFPELEGAHFPTLKERWNAAPSQSLAIVRAAAPTGSSSRRERLEIAEATWGLVPSWSESGKPGPINARSETAATNGMFRGPFKSRRCIVPANGFYEWQERMLQPKRPLYITRADEQPLLMAGLWDRRGDADSFAILTVAAGVTMKPIHDRTPAILEPGGEARAWLDADTTPQQAQSLLHPVADGLLRWHTVSTRVNNPKNEGPELIEPVHDEQ